MTVVGAWLAVVNGASEGQEDNEEKSCRVSCARNEAEAVALLQVGVERVEVDA